MATWVVVMLFSVGAVLLFVVGLSLTLMVKGHHIDGEISTNRHMRARGITCAVHDAVKADGGPRAPGGDAASDCPGTVCTDSNCASCQPR